MIICHYKKTPIAFAPEAISDCINQYTDHTSYVNENFQEADIIQYHNKYFSINHKLKYKIDERSIPSVPSFILYHSFPKIVHNYSSIKVRNKFIYYIFNFLGIKSPSFFIRSNNNSYNINQMVISQFQATLPEYKNYKIVRNPINFYQDEYNININKNKNIKIGYSPSAVKRRSKWENKGINRTSVILNKLTNKFPNIELDIITNVPLDECIRRKSHCDILIDECVTGSFHRSGLEGLALGKLTICSLNDSIIRVLKKSSNSDIVPFENIWIENLEDELIKIIKKGKKFIHNIGRENRLWMEKYWNPKDIANEYIDFYSLFLKKQSNNPIKIKKKIKTEQNTILIIANGRSVLSSNYGPLIDKFKNVARINNYSTANHKRYIGEKTDIWFNGANQGLKKRKITNEKIIIFVPASIQLNKKHRLDKIPKKLGVARNKYTLVSKEEMLSYEKSTKIKRPTTGLSSILWSIKNYNKVIIHGFDFFEKSKGHYFDNIIKTFLINNGMIKMGHKHNNILEKEFVNQLINEKKVITLEEYLKVG